MDTSPVNWESLDSLVIDFAKSENLVEDSSPPSSPCSPAPSPPSSSPSSSLYQSRCLIRQARGLLESGDIDSALDLIRLHFPSVLDDHRLLFRLQKQKFIELLRRGTAEDRESAINCLRTSLAPCALDAYPEAYEEFKHITLALIYDQNDVNSPVVNEWSVRRRFEIAGLVSSILRAHLHAHDPLFSMALRYLISIHKEYCFRQGVSSPISDLTQRLLFGERDLPATPQESYEAPPFDEVDIQALAHAVELTRQGAVDSLKFAKGDLFQAFKNELCRTRLNLSTLDELVREYCFYRGIVDPVPPNSARSGLFTHLGNLNQNQLDAGCSLSRNCSNEADFTNSKHSDGESSITNAQIDVSEDVISMQDTDQDVRFSCEITSNLKDCSTSSRDPPKSSRIAQRVRSYEDGERRRKRWRGRNDDFLSNELISKEQTNLIKEGCEKSCITDTNFSEDKYEILLGIKELSTRGMAAEVVDEVNALDPEFFGQNPLFLFQLKQVEFLKLVGSGDISNALKIACSYLGPLAANDQTLLKSLKETLLAFLRPTEDAPIKNLPLQALASSLQIAVGRRLGVEEPQLMKIMQATLHTYNEWFKLQMCKDRFASLLKIDSLKDAGGPFLADLVSRSNSEAFGHASTHITMSSSSKLEDGSGPSEESSADICDESAILKVMEFLALPRADAIHLLAQYNGSAETVIQQLFA